MKKHLLILLLTPLITLIAAKDYLTVYNNDFALVKTQQEINLEKGMQSFMFEDIPSMIETNSVIFKSKDNKVILFNQNYEYDLANTEAILNKFINKTISFVGEDERLVTGILKFKDFQQIGLINQDSEELMIYPVVRIKEVKLSQLPGNFYTKPTLRWELQAPSKGKYPIQLSYLTRGISWFVTYNTVFKDNKLDVVAWVTMNNQSGKSYQDVNLKLMAGDVNKISLGRGIEDGNMPKYFMVREKENLNAPEFEEKSFADYHLYTLDQTVTISNNQEKQIQLFPLKTVNAKKFYSGDIFGDQKISQSIRFKNAKDEGLGIPLPKGIVKFYQEDQDNTLEFIGENKIDHTALDQDVIINIGKAFDIEKVENVLSDQTANKENVRVISVTLKNKKNENADIEINHNISGNTKILENTIPFEKKNAYQIKFKITLKAGETREFSFKQIIKY